jgi:His/Glu/Gln/Arg/opine family amino acid ABC transporter permease subunit
VITATEQVTPPDRGLRWFLRNQTRWSLGMLGSGIALLVFFFVGSIAVLTHYGWTQVCPEGVTRLECSPSDPLARGIMSGGLGRVGIITMIAAIVVVAAAVATWKRMPNKSSREAVISGGVLAMQALALAAFGLWFRGTDIERFARNFLNLALIGQHTGIVWTSIKENIGGILATGALWGAIVGSLTWVWARIRKGPMKTVAWATGVAALLGFLWGIVDIAEVPSFARGAKNTLVLSGAGALLGFGLGLVLALLTMSNRRVVRAPARVYINFFRGTPLIWQISFAGIGFVPALRLDLSMYTVAILVLGLNLAAYSAEVYRAGIQSLERGQIEASRTLGLSYFQSMRYVIVPQAIRRVIPPLLNEFVILIKDTSLVSVLGLTIAQKELLGTARDFYSTFFDATAWLGAAAGYLIITIPMIRIVTIVERKLRSGLTSVIG